VTPNTGTCETKASREKGWFSQAGLEVLETVAEEAAGERAPDLVESLDR
jgi:hypothetical protein